MVFPSSPLTNSPFSFSNLSGSNFTASFTAGNGVYGNITSVSQSSGIAVLYSGSNSKIITQIQEFSVENLKRVVLRVDGDYFDAKFESPNLIFDFQETKTTWHPIEVIGSAGAGY